MVESIYKNSLIGITISICGNICISLALNLQKLAHKRLQDDSTSKRLIRSKPRRIDDDRLSIDQDFGAEEMDGVVVTDERSSLIEIGYKDIELGNKKNEMKYLYSPIWWIGLILMSLGEFGNFLSYGFAPASLVAPLGTVALISNGIFANFLLGEKFKRCDTYGVILAVLGTFTIVISSPRSIQAFTPEKLLKAISQIPFIIFSSICLLSIVVLGFFSHTKFGDTYIFVDLGICAILGGFTVLSTKAFSSLLNTLLLKCFSYNITWAMFIVMVITAVNQVIFLNRALQKFDSKYVVPVQFVLFTIMAIIGSTILYGDFTQVGSSEVIDFILGCGLIFVGVYMLTTDRDIEDSLIDDDDEDEERGSDGPERQGSEQGGLDGKLEPRGSLSNGPGTIDVAHSRQVSKTVDCDRDSMCNSRSTKSDTRLSPLRNFNPNTSSDNEPIVDRPDPVTTTTSGRSHSVIGFVKRKRSNQVMFPTTRSLNSSGYYLIATSRHNLSSSAV